MDPKGDEEQGTTSGQDERLVSFLRSVERLREDPVEQRRVREFAAEDDLGLEDSTAEPFKTVLSEQLALSSVGSVYGPGLSAHGKTEGVLDALARSAIGTDLEYTLERRLSSDQSSAEVAIVYEHDHRRHSRRQLLLKVGQNIDTPSRPGAFLHWDMDAPDFAIDHVARLVRDPLLFDDGRWASFYSTPRIAAEDAELLGSVLDGILGRLTARPTRWSLHTFIEICVEVLQGALDASRPYVGRSTMVPDFLRERLGHRLNPGGSLGRLRDIHGKTPGPFELLQEGGPAEDIEISPLVGMAHGDLCVDNVLVRSGPEVRSSEFLLIDLSNYGAAPSTYDPVSFLLSLISRSLDSLSPYQHDAILEVLVDSESDQVTYLPLWLSHAVEAISRTGVDWSRSQGYAAEWRKQWLLSLVERALILSTDRTTREADGPWFLRLAARASAVFLSTL